MAFVNKGRSAVTLAQFYTLAHWDAINRPWTERLPSQHFAWMTWMHRAPGVLHVGPANMVLGCGGREVTNGTTVIRTV